MKTLLVLATAAVGALVTVALVASAAPARPPETTSTRGERRLTVTVTPEMLRHSRIRNILYFAGTAYGLGVLLLTLTSGLSRRLRDLAARATKNRYVMSMLYLVLLTAVVNLAELPLTIYSSYVVPHQFGLTDQSPAAWIIDILKAWGVSLLLGLIIVPLGLLAMRMFRKRWWVVIWLGVIPFTLVGFIVWPVFIDPLFNDFVPLRDAALRARLVATAERAGIHDAEVLQVDKSKQTRTLNAYVTGIGPSKRIVIWDTLIAAMDHDEIVSVMGHEMGHYVLRHVWWGFYGTVGFAFVVLFVAQRMVDGGIARWGSKWGVSEAGDPAALPWILLIIGALTFLIEPAVNGLSRHAEHRADVYGLELTRDNEAMASAFVKLAENGKSDPNPNRFIEWWRFSHPAVGRRIEWVLSYRPEGSAPR